MAQHPANPRDVRDDDTAREPTYKQLRHYHRVDGVLYDPDGDPVCTWCLGPFDNTEAFHRDPRKGFYHYRCYDSPRVYKPADKGMLHA